MKTKQEQKEENQKAIKLITVGDIFNYTWGYDQTNQDFYKVTRKSNYCVWVRKLKTKVEETGFMSGNETPINEFETERELRKMPYLYREKPSLSFSFGCCNKWDGKPTQSSWYA